MNKLITYEMKWEMEEGDTKKGKEFALQSVENAKVINDSCELPLKMNLPYLSSNLE